MGTVEFDNWEEIVVPVSKRGNYKTNSIWLVSKHGNKNDDRLNMIMFSSDICTKAGWDNGIRVNLARQGNSLFRFKPSTTGLYTPRKVNKDSRTMCLSGEVLVSEMRPHLNGKEFEAWVDGDTIYCKPKVK